MWSYIVRRLLGLVPVLFGITLLVFLFLQLIPGDPAQAILGERGTPEQLAALREKLGLNRPLYVQYLTFVRNVLTGDLGTSAVSTIPVAEELKRRWPATFELALAATLVAVIFGIPVGILAAVRKNSLLDTLSMSLSLVGVSMPVFSWPGIGSYIYEGILNRDYPVVQAGVLVVATAFVLVNLLVDLSYALLDPRIQYR
jgi:peptide/nickel transport system permease protein